MRLGSNILQPHQTPQEWAAQVKAKGYRAAYSPLRGGESDDVIAAYAKAARDADIVIAEQGAWNINCLSPDDATRKAALDYCIERLDLAERIGARCCVALAGTRGDGWCGPHRDNVSEDMFALTADNCRAIIDAVKPKRSYFTMEAMPWCYPYDVASYERLLLAVDRPAFGVHYDPVNLIYSPERYFNVAAYLHEFVTRLGSRIRSCHAKDVLLTDRFILDLKEVPAGQGGFDYPTFLRELDTLDPDLPLMLEHLDSNEAYDSAAAYIRGQAAQLGIKL